MRKVFLDDLPKRKNGSILWNKSVGQKIKFIYEEISGEFLVLDYYNIKDTDYMLKLKYNDSIVETRPCNLLTANISKVIKYKKKHKYIHSVGDVISDNKRHITITGFKDKEVNRHDGKKEIKYGYSFQCGICGWNDGWISEKELEYGGGCSCCHSKTVVPGINDIPTTAPWMVDYFQGGYEEAKQYTKTSMRKIYPKCPYCGRVSNKRSTITNIYANHGFPCICSDSLSKISKYIRVLLEQLKENGQINKYDTEIKFDWCKFHSPYKNKECYGIYDFLIEERKLIIEADGGFHRNDNLMSGQTLEEAQFIDRTKDSLAKDNGYTIIRISDEYDIKQSIIDNLSDIFSLECIEWTKCEIDSMSSYLLKVCKLKKDNPNLGVSDISEMLHFGKTTIRRWLAHGAKYGLCVYDPEEELRRSLFSSDRINSCEKQIICLNNGMTFSSGIELANKSEELFDQKLSRANISCCCHRKINDINGLVFRFYRDLNDDEKRQLDINVKNIKLQEINHSILDSFEKYISQNKISDDSLLELFKEKTEILDFLKAS